MNRDLQRLAFLLASSGLTEAEISRALRIVERDGIKPFLRLVADARITIHLASQKLDAPDSTQRWRPSRGREENGPDALAGDIARSLDEDLGLPAGQVVIALRNSLLADPRIATTHDKIPALRPKEGLKRWLGRLVRIIPSSVLLHHVSKIKNEVSRRKPGDWPLRDRHE